MNKKVFITNDGGQDFSAAEEFGELIYCTDGNVDKFNISQMFRGLSETLNDSEAHDYLLLTSLTSLCSVASAIMAAKHGEVHFLIYQDKKYLVKDLML